MLTTKFKKYEHNKLTFQQHSQKQRAIFSASWFDMTDKLQIWSGSQEVIILSIVIYSVEYITLQMCIRD